MLGCLFVMCAAIGLFISNTATAVLMAPIACGGVSMGVAVSSWWWRWRPAFMTPVSSPVNTLVLGPVSIHWLSSDLSNRRAL